MSKTQSEAEPHRATRRDRSPAFGPLLRGRPPLVHPPTFSPGKHPARWSGATIRSVWAEGLGLLPNFLGLPTALRRLTCSTC
jgi:hypothetical protein